MKGAPLLERLRNADVVDYPWATQDLCEEAAVTITELLEVLEHLLKVRTREGVKPQSRDAAEAKARAAIKKARGQ